MKKLSIEDKAKAYDNAFERAKAFNKTWQCIQAIDSELALKELKEIFPELKESEDEKAREEIKQLIQCMHDADPRKERWLAWLEKQGAQNLADNPETAFHEGDWIVQENIGVYKVIEVCESWYEVIDIEDNHYSISFDKEYMCHFWSIKDAKDGDVLSYVTDEEDLWIMIYWSLYEPYEGHVHYHALLVNDNFSDKGTCCICINDLKPATKEQRGILFQKVHEAGYEWNDKRKKLRKINQKRKNYGTVYRQKQSRRHP